MSHHFERAKRVEKSRKFEKGFTLVELMVVIGLIAMIGTLGMLLSFDYYRNNSFFSEQKIIVSVLQKARNQAMNNVCQGTCTKGKAHGVKFDKVANKYIIFQGNSYGARDTAFDDEIEVTPTISISGMDEVVFSQLSGNASVTGGNLTVSGSGRTAVIEVNSNGRIDVQ